MNHCNHLLQTPQRNGTLTELSDARRVPANGFVALLTLLTLLLFMAPKTTLAATLDYIMQLDSVTVQYDGTSYTNQPLTLKFLGYDTANLTMFAGSMPFAKFTNGANMRVTVGSILTDAELDSRAENSSGLIESSSGAIYFGYVSDGTYSTDRGFLTSFASTPATLPGLLTTAWDSTVNNATVSGPWDSSSTTSEASPQTDESWGDNRCWAAPVERRKTKLPV